jgi:putative ABC transport system permease protein
MSWWQRLRRRWRLEQELDAELRFHLDRLVADYMADGCSERDARQKAREAFGGLEAVKDDCRDARGTRWAHDLAHDVRFAGRLLAKDRGFTAVAVLALALGIGVNNTLFTIVNALCIRGLPIAEPGRVIDISERDPTHPFLLLTPRQFDTIETSRPDALQSVAAYASRPATLLDDQIAAETVTVAYVSPAAMATIGQTPLLGRDFVTEDTRAGGPPVALIAAGIWKTRYGSDPRIIGRIVGLNGIPVSVVGVMPDGFKFPDNADVWRPLGTLRLTPDTRLLRTYARLAPGATISQARDAVASLMAHAPSATTATDSRLVVVPINSRFVGDITDPGWMSFIAVGIFLVVIACSNVANLVLARGAARGHEMAVRVSLGATRLRIVRQLLIESAMLAGLGGLAAIGVSFVGLTLLSAATPPGSLPYWVTLTMDGRVALMLVIVVLGTVLLFGLAPALQLSRTSPYAIVKQTGAGVTADRGHRRWTWIFLTAQLALTVIVLAQLSVTVMQYYVLQTRDPAIDADHILTFEVTLPPDAYRSPDQRQHFFSRLAQRLEDSRGARSVSVAGTLPFRPGPRWRIVPDTQAILNTTPPVMAAAVDAAFFQTLGVTVIEGRAFSRDVATDRQRGIIVNQRLAQMLFPGLSAVGRRVRLESAGQAPAEEVRTIVGVVPAFRQQPTFQPDPFAYLPLSPDAMSTATVLVRTDGDMGLLADAIRDELRALDPNIPANRLMTLEHARWEARWTARVSTQILTTIALVALLLSTIGLAALTTYSVWQRRRELGIRLALGATRQQIVRLVLRRVLTQVFVGLAFGWIASMAWNRLFRVQGANGPVNITIVAIVLATVALAMSAWPALRASRIDPLVILRQE